MERLTVWLQESYQTGMSFKEMMAIAETLNVKYEQAFVLADETKISMGSYKV